MMGGAGVAPRNAQASGDTPREEDYHTMTSTTPIRIYDASGALVARVSEPHWAGILVGYVGDGATVRTGAGRGRLLLALDDRYDANDALESFDTAADRIADAQRGDPRS